MRILVSLFAVVGVCCFAVPASADSYSWEDGTGTILGSYGNLVDPTNVTGSQTGSKGDVAPGTWTCPGAQDGERYLHVAEEPHSGTPQAYVAWITNLQEGDMVYVSMWGFDDEAEDPSPSLRLWGGYSPNADITIYTGSAGEGLTNSGYTSGIGWEEMSSSWLHPAGQEALVIQLRLYSSPSTGDYRTDYWGDLITVTTDSETAQIHFAPEPTSLVLLALGGLLLRRR